MTRYADPSVCPDCHAGLPTDPATCPACGLPLRGPLAVSLFRVLSTADDLLARLRATADAPAAIRDAPLTSVRTDPILPATAASTTSTPPASPPVAPRRTGLSGVSVASVLLGLGALCLLVAAVTFLAVAWSWLGIGGRTVVLVGLTLTAATAGRWLERRGLRLAAEALTVVALGLLALDAVGAQNAGWLGDLSLSGTLALVGGTELAGSLALVLLPGRLVVPQVGAVLGLAALLGGAGGLSEHDQVVLVAGVLAYAALAALGRSRAAALLPLLSLVGAGLTWWLLAQLALTDAADHPSLGGLWAQGHGVGLLAAAALLLLPAAVLRPRPPYVLLGGVAAAAFVVTLAVWLPATDEGPTALAVMALVLLLAWSAAAAVVPVGWRPVTWPALALGAVPVGVLVLAQLAEATARLALVGDPFSASAGVSLPASPGFDDGVLAHPPLLVPGVLGLLVALACVTRSRGRATWPLAAAVVALAGAATLALLPVPLWTVVVPVAVVALALVAGALDRDDRVGVVRAGAGGVVVLVATAIALPSAVLTTIALGALVLAAAAVAVVGRFPHARSAAWAVLPAASAALLWSAAEVAGVDPAYRGVPVLLVVGLLAIRWPRAEGELSAAAGGALAAVAAVDAASVVATSHALHLTVAGALVTATALLHPSRRPLGWLGGALLAAATWVRLAQIGVEAPEAYTLPSAAALVLVGLHRLRRDPAVPTLTALAPGLVLATVPSLLWVLAGDVVSVRALLLGLGCLLLVLAGVRQHWNAPLVVGSGVGALLVVRELAPYVGSVPQWVVIGLAGLLLTAVGVTWERRMLELRHAAAYLGRLR
jgi:hypothetical protein